MDRLVHAADFQRLLKAPSRWRGPHFALHYLASRPVRRAGPVIPELSTDAAPSGGSPVDDLPETAWCGVVVPKRHARRAVTRSLLKRQIKAAMARHESALPKGVWVVRLRAPFARDDFPSAASTALRTAVRQELDALLARASA